MKIRVRERVLGGGLLLPSVLGMLLFYLLPMGEVLIRSFRGAVGGQFIGLQNYKALWENAAFWMALKNTGTFTLVCIPLLVGVSLLLALGLSAVHKIGQGFRTVYLMPMAIPAASVVLVWKVLFHDRGLLNSLGMGTVSWMHSGASFWMLMGSYLWKNLGYTVVLWAAGLGNIPKSIYEAARMDGAGGWQTFWFVTFPNLKGTAYTIVVLSILNSFKVFREAWLVAGDYPDEHIYLMQHLYNNWFRNLNFDKIAAASVVTSLVVFVLIGILRRVWDKEENV